MVLRYCPSTSTSSVFGIFALTPPLDMVSSGVTLMGVRKMTFCAMSKRVILKYR